MPEHVQTRDTSSVLDLSDWKSRITSGRDGGDAIVRKQAIANAEDLGNRQIKFTISTGGVDRENDRLSADGWSLKSYRKNPVVMFAHDYKQLPVARAVSISQENGNLVSTAEFATADLNPFAETVYRMIKGGFLNAVSVGFRPQKFKSAERDNGQQGFDFEEQELLEYSVVPIPANPQALVAASKHGIDLDPITVWAKSWLEKAVPEHVRFKGMVPANPADYGLAPMGEEWSRPSLRDFTSDSWDEVESEDRLAIARHFTYAAEMPPTNYGDLKLPHHRAKGADVVFRGVAAASGRLDQTDFTADDFSKIRSHLANHYKEFDRVAPWERSGESWAAFVANRDSMIREVSAGRDSWLQDEVRQGEIPDVELSVLLRMHGFKDEADAVQGVVADETGSSLGDVIPDIAADEYVAEGQSMATATPKQVDSDQLNDSLDEIRQQMNAIKVSVRATIRNVDRLQNASKANGDTPNKSTPDEEERLIPQVNSDGSDDFIDLVDNASDDCLDIDPVMLRDVLVDATKDTVAQVVNHEVRAMVNRVSGRVD